MSLIQLLRFQTWETRLSKMPGLETGTRITVAYGIFHATFNILRFSKDSIFYR